MSSTGEKPAGVIEVRAVWVAAGILALVLHFPLTAAVGLAIALPWTGALLVLSHPQTAAPAVFALRDALFARKGIFGSAGLLLAGWAVAVVVSPGAGLLLGLWIAAAAFAVGVSRGGAVLEEQLVKWALLLLTTLLGLGAAEGVLRIESVAGRVGTPREIDAWWQRYDGVWERNPLGIRSRYETLRKEPGVFRVVALGDSYTWGDKIARSDSIWPSLLEDRLTGRLPNTRLEVINLGQKGFTSVNEAEMLRRIGWQFDPDAVVVQFYLNDILPSGPDFERGYSGWIFPRAWILPERYKHGHAGRSALLYVAESVLTRWRHGDREAQAEKWTEVYTRRGPEWGDLEAALREMASAARARGVPIVLMLFPDFIPGMTEGAENPLRTIHDQTIEVAEAAGYSILDMTPVFIRENADMRSWWTTPYDAHPNEAAALVTAQSLADHLLAEVEPLASLAAAAERHEQ
jgi:lysophospholipase L1-like esterase